MSFVFKGGIRHRDTQGNDKTVLAGGTQWMHAGRGILHDETPLAGEAEIIQLWINSPAGHKSLVTLHVVAGELAGVKGPIRTLTPINAATIDARRGGRIDIALPPTHNAFLYLLDGAVRFPDGTTASGLHQAVFRNDGESVGFEAIEDTRALLMSGQPIGEAIVSYGPFVMNTQEEIRAAFRDYRNGDMGLVP